MEQKRLIVWTLSICLILTISTAKESCPRCCVCRDVSATCTHLQIVPNNFPEHIVNITITQSTFNTMGPLVLGKHARNIVFRNTEITSIGEHFLRDSFSPLTLEFATVVINTISSGAFSNIRNLISLNFNTAIIGIIEKEAFTSFSTAGQISMKTTNIETIKAGAFRNISVSKFMITDCDIVEIETASFNSLHISDLIRLNDVTIRSMKKEAFRNLKEIRRVYIENCKFLAMECNAIMDLREATLNPSESFFFNNSTLECDCSGVFLFQYVQWNPDSVSETVSCFSRNDSRLRGPVLKIKDNYQKICLHEVPNGCKVDILQHTRSTSASVDTDFKPRVVTPNRQEDAHKTNAVAMSQSPRWADLISTKAPGRDTVSDASNAAGLQILALNNIAVICQTPSLILFMSMIVHFYFHRLES